MRQKITLTESQLHRVILNSAKNLLREMAYGKDFSDTMKWVQKKFPNKSPEEQRKFAINIVKKFHRTQGLPEPTESELSDNTADVVNNAPQPEQSESLVPDDIMAKANGFVVCSQSGYEQEDEFQDFYLEKGLKPVRFSFSYAHGQLESDMGFDVFYIYTDKFDESVVEKLDRYRKNIDKLYYQNKPCTFYGYINPRLMQYTGLLVYDDDAESVAYAKKIQEEMPERF